MLRPRIIAFGHKSRVGKDTITKMMLDLLNVRYPKLQIERRSFADKVKDVAHQLYKHHGLRPGKYYEDNPDARCIKLSTLDKDPVEIWVDVGNKVREIYSETWVDYALMDATADLIIISDLRYPNEAKRIIELGGCCIKLEKFDAPIRDTIADNALNDFSNWFEVIYNTGDLTNLQKEGVNLLSKLGWLT